MLFFRLTTIYVVSEMAISETEPSRQTDRNIYDGIPYTFYSSAFSILPVMEVYTRPHTHVHTRTHTRTHIHIYTRHTLRGTQSIICRVHKRVEKYHDSVIRRPLCTDLYMGVYIYIYIT